MSCVRDGRLLGKLIYSFFCTILFSIEAEEAQAKIEELRD